jgi:AhpD family alkylhydroperoxidase
MTPGERIDAQGRPDATSRLEDLIPIAVVIAAGCEGCAESMVRRALRNGATRRQIERTLKIVAHLRSTDCFQRAVGVELAGRMDGPLTAAVNALSEPSAATEERVVGQADGGACCGPLRASNVRDAV